MRLSWSSNSTTNSWQLCHHQLLIYLMDECLVLRILYIQWINFDSNVVFNLELVVVMEHKTHDGHWFQTHSIGFKLVFIYLFTRDKCERFSPFDRNGINKNVLYDRMEWPLTDGWTGWMKRFFNIDNHGNYRKISRQLLDNLKKSNSKWIRNRMETDKFIHTSLVQATASFHKTFTSENLIILSIRGAS